MALPLRLRSFIAPPRRGIGRTNLSQSDCHSRRRLEGWHPIVHDNGYTLHEALITLVIAGILTVSAVGFMHVVRNDYIVSQANALVADLSLARSEAIKRGQAIAICKSATGESCTEDAQWHEGWLIFTDENESGTLDDGEEVIRVNQALERGLTLTYSAFGPGVGKYIIYRSTGSTKEQNGTFRFCDISGSAIPRAVIVFKTGRVRTSTKNAGGDPIVCP